VLRLRRDGVGTDGQAARPLRVEKTLTLSGGRRDPAIRLDVAVENRAGTPIETVLAVEWAIDLAGGGGNPQAYYQVVGTRTAHDGWGAHEAPGVVAFGNDWLGVEVEAVAEPTAGVWWQPIETVSNSEGGFERVYQGSALVFRWPLRLEPAASRSVSVVLTTRCRRDRRAEELMA